MNISISTLQGRVPITVLRPQGNLDASTSDEFSSAAAKVVADGAKDILIDLSEVPFVSSAGIRALHTLYNSLHPAGTGQDKEDVYKGISAGTYAAPHLKLLYPNKKVSEALKLAGLDMYLKMYDSELEAVAAF
jgi:anti-anti-sigma factor